MFMCEGSDAVQIKSHAHMGKREQQIRVAHRIVHERHSSIRIHGPRVFAALPGTHLVTTSAVCAIAEERGGRMEEQAPLRS
jgi:hypothetical protein